MPLRRNVEVDLHLHTTHSDGRLTISEMVALCVGRGLKSISITDHDTTSGLVESQEIANSMGIELIPGIELGTNLDGSELHILGYFVDGSKMNLEHKLEEFRRDRLTRGAKIVEKLVHMGLKIEWDMVLQLSNGGSVGRPHIAQALVESGYADNPKDAFDRLIGSGRPAFVPRNLMTPVQAINLLTDNGALPVLAHPLASESKSGRKGIDNLDVLIPELCKAGLVGVEVYYADYTQKQIARLATLAEKHFLVPCGGSDYHAAGNPIEPEPGEVGPPMQTVAMLKEKKAVQNAI